MQFNWAELHVENIHWAIVKPSCYQWPPFVTCGFAHKVTLPVQFTEKIFTYKSWMLNWYKIPKWKSYSITNKLVVIVIFKPAGHKPIRPMIMVCQSQIFMGGLMLKGSWFHWLDENKKGQNCKRPTIWPNSFHMICEWEMCRHPD